MIAVGLAAGGTLWWREHRRKREVRERFRGRVRISPAEFAGEAGRSPDVASEAARFLKLVGEAFRIDPGLLRPGDRLGADLGAREISRQRQVFLIAELERAFDRELPAAETCLEETLAELLGRLVGQP